MKKFLPYTVITLINFYLLPVFAQNTGIAMIIMLFILPFIVFTGGAVFASRYGFSFVSILITMAFFIPAIFIYYNPSAWVYIIFYGTIALIGNCVGLIFYKNKL